MRISLFKIFLFLIILNNDCGLLLGQTIKTLADGQKIVVFPDGSWRRYQEPIVNTNEGTLALAVTDKPLATDEQTTDFIYTIADVPELEELVVKNIKNYRDKVNIKYEKQENLENIRSKPNVTEEELIDATHQMEVGLKEEESALQILEASKADLKKARITPALKQSKRDKAKAIESKQKDLSKSSNTQISSEADSKEEDNRTEDSVENQKISFKEEELKEQSTKTDASKKVKAKSQCGVAYRGVDEFTKKKRLELNSDIFFSYTNPAIKQVLQDKEMIQCEGYMSAISGGYRYLLLTFSFPTLEIRKDFGTYREGAFLQLKFIDEDNISLYNTGVDDIRLNQKTGMYDIKAQFAIDYKQEKILRKKEIDKVRITWTSGYEDYDVYNTSFLKNQLNCLEQELK